MSVKRLITTAIVLVALTVTATAQTVGPDEALPAHPFLGLEIAPQNPQGSPDQVVPAQSETGPAAPIAPSIPAQNATPAQPGQDPSALPPGHPVVAPVAPGQLQIITDPRMLQQLFGGGPQMPTKPTPEMLESVYVQIWKQVAQSYHDPARLKDWHEYAAKYKGKLNTEEDLEKALKDMLGSLNDPWTKYISVDEIKKGQANAQAGISDLGLWIVRQPDGSFKIDYTTYGTPSYASGMHKGDELKSVGGKPLKGLSQEEAEALLSGKDGTAVEVVYARNGQEVKETLTFARAQPNQVVANLMAGNIGYVRLPSFDNQSFAGFVQALQALHANSNGQLNGLVLDLRGNSGGLVNLALQVASVFMEKGAVVTSTTRDGRMVTHQTYEVVAPLPHDFMGAPDEVVTMIKDFYAVPLVVLVDGSSASSSEIVTGALKDSGRGTIIGTTTYGKGVGYNVGRIPPGGVLHITTMNYLTPSGYNLSNKGIAPQIVVERTPGAKVDEQLNKAVELIKEKNPDPFANPDLDAPKKQFGEGEWTQNPIAISLGVAAFLLLVVLFARNHVLAARRRKEEAQRDAESE